MTRNGREKVPVSFRLTENQSELPLASEYFQERNIAETAMRGVSSADKGVEEQGTE
jgi:hypothetical protein